MYEIKKHTLASDNPENAYKEDYHGHPKYKGIYYTLVILLVATLIPNIVNMIAGAPVLKAVWWVVALIFILSTWKAVLVINNFMHMRYEPMLVGGIVVFSFALLVAIFGLVWADLAHITNPNSKSDIETVRSGRLETYSVNGHEKTYEVIDIEATKTTRGGTKILKKKFDFASIDKHLHR